MAWVKKGNLKGPIGPAGPAGSNQIPRQPEPPIDVAAGSFWIQTDPVSGSDLRLYIRRNNASASAPLGATGMLGAG
jgi:hypothetical protein